MLLSPSLWECWFGVFVNDFKCQKILQNKIITVWSVLMLKNNDIRVLSFPPPPGYLFL